MKFAMVCCVLFVGGCTAARQSATGPDVQQASGQVAANLNAEVQAELAGLRQDVGEQVNALVNRVDQSVNNYDAWTLRINAFLPWIVIGLPLVAYVLPKLAWEAASAASRRVLKHSSKKQ